MPDQFDSAEVTVTGITTSPIDGLTLSFTPGFPFLDRLDV